MDLSPLQIRGLSAPRHWLGREGGECAFPVGGEGVNLFSCCSPCGRHLYCPTHRKVMRGRRAASLERLEANLRRYGI